MIDDLVEAEIHPKEYIAARDDLAWFFGASEAAMGFHAQGYDVGGESVWDEARITALHRRMLVKIPEQVKRQSRIREALSQVPWTVEVFRLVYTPFGMRRFTTSTSDGMDRSNWDAYRLFRVQDRSLLALALSSPEMKTAFLRKHPAATPDQAALIAFVGNEIESLQHAKTQLGKALPIGHCLWPALRSADKREEDATKAFIPHRIASLKRLHSEAEAARVTLLAKERARAESAEREFLEKRHRARLRSGSGS